MSSRILLQTYEDEFRKAKKISEAAMAQVDDAGLHAQINPRQNSIATIIQHLSGNMMSRWTDFLTTDGEKPDRNRESEFVDRMLPRTELMALWEKGWQCGFDALSSLSDTDLTRTVYIRRQPLSVAAAIVRQVAHCGWHAGQIALIAKHLKGENWQYLTIPPQQSTEFNRQMGM